MAASTSSLPCRVLHCERGVLRCGECLGLLALALAEELFFDPRLAEEMSLEFYLAAMGADRERAPEAEGLRELTMGIASSEGIACSGAPSARIPEAVRRSDAGFWVGLGVFTLGSLALILCLERLAMVVLGR